MLEDGPLQERWEAMEPHLDERARRLFVASEAKSAGYGGIVSVARATGMARSTIGRGLKDLAVPEALEPGRVRRPGGGRKSLISASPQLLADLNALVDPDARGDPMSPLRWTAKSLRRLARELRERGHKISHTVVGELLKQLNFSLQANSKTREGAACPDHDAQFGHIGASVKSALAENQPVISVDTKKKRTGWRLQEQRPGMAAQGRSRGGAGPRLPHQRARPGRALRCVRSGGQYRLG
jgi:transposase